MDKLKTIIRLRLVGFFESLGLDIPPEAKIEQFTEGLMEDLNREIWG